MFEAKHIVVTGGSSGIGLGVVRAALAAGARVTMVSRNQGKLAAACEALGHPAGLSSIAADITRENDIIRLFSTLGEFDHLINSAVDASYQPIVNFDIDAAKNALNSKIIGALLLLKHGSSTIAKTGSFVLISGIAADRPIRGGSMIAAANGALASLAKAAAIELAPVRVNVVSPGWVDTPVWDRLTATGPSKAERFSQHAAKLPAGRVGHVDDIAQAVLALFANSYITGTVLDVNGGHHLI